jgi:hypothetical protein
MTLQGANIVCDDLGQIYPKPLAGSWIDTYSDPVEVVQCVPEKACSSLTSMAEIGNGTCAAENEGNGTIKAYTGFACAFCADGFYRSSSSTCLQCPNNNWLVFTLLGVLMLLTPALLKISQLEQGFGALNIAVTYAQVNDFFLQFDWDWPISLEKYYSKINFVSLNLDVFNPECYAGSYTFSDKFYITMAMPVIVCGMLYTWMLGARVKHWFATKYRLAVREMYTAKCRLRSLSSKLSDANCPTSKVAPSGAKVAPKPEANSGNGAHVKGEGFNGEQGGERGAERVDEVGREEGAEIGDTRDIAEEAKKFGQPLSRLQRSMDSFVESITTASSAEHIHHLRSAVIGSVVLTLSWSYFTLSSVVLQHFNCVQTTVGHVIASNPDTPCWDWEYFGEANRHSTLFPWVVLCVALYPIGIPVYFAFVLVKSMKWVAVKDAVNLTPKENKKRMTYMRRYGVLYKCYEAEAWWWELTNLARKLVMSLALLTF